MKKIVGVTMVELLASLTISVVIVSGLISVYWVTQKYFRVQAALLSLSENSRIAEQLWMTSIRSAAYRGCLKAEKIDITPYYHDDVKPGTDAITIGYADTEGDDVLLDMKVSNVIYATKNHRVSVNDDMIISDCDSVNFFKVKKVIISSAYQKIISEKSIKKLYKKFAQLSVYHQESYYIGNTHRYDKHHQYIDALYRRNRGEKKIEILEGIDDMKITYSILKEGVMIDKTTANISENDNITGIAILLKHTSLIEHGLNKMQNCYVSIR